MSEYVMSLSNRVHVLRFRSATFGTVVTLCGKWLRRGHNGTSYDYDDFGDRSHCQACAKQSAS